MNPGTEIAAGGADGFEGSRSEFDSIVGWLDSPDTAGLDHGVLEEQLRTRSRELLRRLFQDHLDLRAAREEGPPERRGDHHCDNDEHCRRGE